MAIRERKDRGAWQVYWKNPHTGKQETCLCASKKEAQKMNEQVKYRLKFERENFAFEAVQEEKDDDSLEAIDYAYLQEKKPSVKSLEWHLDGMKLPLKLIGRKRIGAITRQDLAKVLSAHMAKKGIKPVTVRGRMKILYTLLRWAVKRGYLDNLPVLPELPAAHYEQLIPPSMEEASRIYASAPDHLKRVIIIGAKLGVRVGPSELFKLTWHDVDFQKGVLRVHAAAKNPKEPWREVPIKSTLINVFKEWMLRDVKAGIEYIIHYNGHPIKSIQTSWENTLKRAGITRRIRPYDLRHAFATDAIAAGADVGTVARLMGHSTPQMVLTHYQHVMTKQKREAVEALPDITQYAQTSMHKKEGAMLQ